MTERQKKTVADALLKLREADEALESIGCAALRNVLQEARVQLGAVYQYDIKGADALLAHPTPTTDELIQRLRASGLGLEVVAADRLEEMQERLAICAEVLA